jgi:hypothetical protein
LELVRASLRRTSSRPLSLEHRGELEHITGDGPAPASELPEAGFLKATTKLDESGCTHNRIADDHEHLPAGGFR